jgi:hypothetical protein
MKKVQNWLAKLFKETKIYNDNDLVEYKIARVRATKIYKTQENRLRHSWQMKLKTTQKASTHTLGRK